MTGVAFYKGEISHRRYGQRKHYFKYRLTYILIDLDRLDEARNTATFFCVNRPAPIGFRERDFGGGDERGLNTWVRRYLKDHGVDDTAKRIELLCLPHMFGYAFNPISVFYIYGDNNRLHHLLYQVNNTFGDRIFYLCNANQADQFYRHEHAKRLYVSPFYDVSGNYHFTITKPTDDLVLHILYTDSEKSKTLNSNLICNRQNVTNATIIKTLLAYPLMTFGVVAAIHWQAAKLFIKGVRYRSQDEAYGVNAADKVKPTASGLTGSAPSQGG